MKWNNIRFRDGEREHENSRVKSEKLDFAFVWKRRARSDPFLSISADILLNTQFPLIFTRGFKMAGETFSEWGGHFQSEKLRRRIYFAQPKCFKFGNPVRDPFHKGIREVWIKFAGGAKVLVVRIKFFFVFAEFSFPRKRHNEKCLNSINIFLVIPNKTWHFARR